MNCDRIKEHLPFIDDGSLEQDTSFEVHEHLKSCSKCRNEYEEIQKAVNLVNSVLVKNIPDNSQRILDGVQRKIQSRKRERRIYWRILPAAAVILITVSMAYYSIMPKPANYLVPPAYANNELSDEEFYDYVAEQLIAEQHFDVYELYELVDETEVIDEYDLREALYHHDYFSVSLEDVIETLDYDELNYLYVSTYN